MQLLDIIIYGVAFLGTLLLVEGLFYLWVDYRGGRFYQINQRMRMLAAGHKRDDVMLQLRQEQRFDPEATGLKGLLGRLDAYLTQAGYTMRIETFLFICIVLFVVAILGLFVAGTLNVLTGLFAGLLAMLLPVMLVRVKRSRRIRRFDHQLPRAIDIVVRALRAGHPVSSAVGLAAKEMEDPIGSEFGLMVDEMQFGLDLNEAMTNMEQRVGSTDLRILVISVQIQSQVGGNLAEILSTISKVIRERFRLQAKARALSAEGRFSALVLTLMPFVMLGVITLLNPDYYGAVQDDPLFMPVAGFGFGLMFFGIIVIHRMVNLKV